MKLRPLRVSIRFLAWSSVAAIVALSVPFSFHPLHWDLSPGKTYTVSSFTKEILEGLDSEVSVTWYRSRDLERMTPAIRYIDSFLEEYRAASGGRLSYTVKDPSLSGSMARIERLGIVPRQTSVRGKDGSSIKALYSGLVIEYRGDFRSIPFLLDSKSLEYEITRIILDLARPPTPETAAFREIQVITGNASLNADYRYLDAWVSYAGFNLAMKELPVESLDPRMKLLVLGSSDLDDATVGSIQRFLDDGGNAIFFVSGNEIGATADWKARQKAVDRLLALLAARGFLIERGIAMDVLSFTVTLPSLDNSRYAEVEYPFWITVPRAGFALDEPVFSGIESLQFFWPSPIATSEGVDGLRDLARATSRAKVMVEPYDTNPFGGQKGLLTDTGHGTGLVSSPAVPLIAASRKKGRVIVIADEWFPSTIVDYTGNEGNLDFSVNCVEWISGEDSLLALKDRTGPDEQDRLSPDGERKDTSAIVRARALNLVAIPALLVASLVVCAFSRRRKR